jgi:D-alanyl-D-alanine carboxypeptidase
MSTTQRMATTRRIPKGARRALLAGAAVLVGSLAAAGCGSSAAPQDVADKAAIQAKMDRLVSLGVPGITVLVRDGEKSLQLTAGVSDLETKTAVDPDDRFRIGSLAKPYVATVVMQLAEEGKLGLADTVEHWQPGTVPNGANITLRQLLNHTSGIGDYAEVSQEVNAPYLKGDLGHVWTPRQLVKIAVDAGPLFAPGADVHYSNTNFTLLGLIVEKASGNSLEHELKTRIFEPLKLTSTSFATDGRMTAPYAHGYLVGSGTPLDVTELYPYYWGAGNLVADADDVAVFYKALLSGRLVSSASLAEMKTLVMQTPQRGQGLGLVSGENRCGKFFGHDGSVPGYFSDALVMNSGREVVFLVNSVSIEDTVANPQAQKVLGQLVETAACST